MKARMDLRTMDWLSRPEYYILQPDKVILETQPHTDLFSVQPGIGEAAGLLKQTGDSFAFTARVDYSFFGPGDQCGIVIKGQTDRWCTASVICRQEHACELACRVHIGFLDCSGRTIGSQIKSMYLRAVYQQGDVLLQYSFSGGAYTDMRHFQVATQARTLQVGIYACSLNNTYFDATFTQVTLEEQIRTADFREENYRNER